MSGWTDTHCHLNDEDAFPDPEAAVREARDSGVDRLVVVGVDTESSQKAVVLSERFENIWAVVGWHPNMAANFSLAELSRIEELAQHPKVVAIGEIGLDFHWTYATLEQQRLALEAQLDLAEKLNRPVVFHCREAYPELLTVLESRPARPYLLHCFAGSGDDAVRAMTLGCYFGVDGPVTYKKADDLRSVIRQIGIERLVVETDAPWLSPHPHRGKPNQPAWVGIVGEGLADTLGLSTETVKSITNQNADSFFRLR